MIRKLINRKKMVSAAVLAGLLISVSVPSLAAEGQAYQERDITAENQRSGPAGPGMEEVPGRFVLPEGARVLVIVEGTGGSGCRVSAWEKPYDGRDWELKFRTDGNLGYNGMSNHRVMGDKTTPIGVFQMNTPFGQDDPLKGFPSNYVKVKESHVWEDETNTLVDGSEKEGERVGTGKYAGYYDYAIDAGFNKEAIPNQGSALFLHCMPEGVEFSSGCVQIPKEKMAEVMKLYGTYGDGACYIAQAPRGKFGLIYDTYGTNHGLSPEGDFSDGE